MIYKDKPQSLHFNIKLLIPFCVLSSEKGNVVVKIIPLVPCWIQIHSYAMTEMFFV